MEITVKRMISDSLSTLGVMHVEGKYECFTCEDAHRDIKVKDETRIPEGRYEIKYREVLSGMTERYRRKFPWFTWHLELQDVPDYKYVYIHSGNTADQSSGCILVGASASQSPEGWFVGSSRPTYGALYRSIARALNEGEKVFITVSD